MYRLALAALLLSGTVLARDPASSRDPAAPKSAPLQGTWRLVAIQEGARTVTADMELTVTFTAAEIIRRVPGFEVTSRYQVDTSKRPAWITLDNQVEGIYQVTGDTLRVAMSRPGLRPDALHGLEKAGNRVAILRRVRGK